MYIKYSQNKYATIVETYRADNTIKTRVLLNLGPVRSEDDRKRFEQILRDMKTGNEFVKLNDISAKNAKEFGVTYTTAKLLEKYGLDAILQRHLSVNKARFNVYDIIKALIVNRLVKPSSDLAALDWISKHYPENIQIQEQYIYRALDYLIEQKEGIEKDLFTTLKQKLHLNTDTVHYDLTSSYFEGSCCEIAMFGYSRDHRKDRKQIALGLAMCDGIPIMHEVCKGNTVDKTTLKGMQENLRKRFRITDTTIVADAGLLTKDNQETLEDDGFHYILGFHRRNSNISKQLLIKNIQSTQHQHAREVHTEEIVRGDKRFVRRYILCINKETRKERLEKLGIIKTSVEKKLKELNEQYRKSQAGRGKKMKRDDCMLKASKILGRNKRLFTIGFKNGLICSLNKKRWEYENKIAGKFLLVTNTNKEPDEVMKAYKELQVVENAFDEIKNFLDIRPMHHHKERRVKAHAFVCVLAFLVECIIARFSSQTARKVINELETVKSVEIASKKHSKRLVTTLSPETEQIFEELMINKPFIL